MKTAAKTTAKKAPAQAAKSSKKAAPASEASRKAIRKAGQSASAKSAARAVRKGLFVSFEGGEGVGKTTQIARLAKTFEADGRKVTVTREPGGSQIANRIRSILLDPKNKGLVPLAELFLYEASRAQHVSDVIQPALAAGHVVICDRFADSSIVYQGVARGLAADFVHKLNQIATGGLAPDVTLVLDLDPRIGLARVGSRGILDRMEQEALSFHQAVRAGFLALAKKNRRRCRVIDASRSRDSIHEQIIEALEGFLI
jgi:dTMP kinase